METNVKAGKSMEPEEEIRAKELIYMNTWNTRTCQDFELSLYKS